MGLLGFKKPHFIKNAIERFEDQLTAIFGVNALVYRQKSKNRRLPSVFTLIFNNTPSRGLLTACTFGVSFGDQQVWGDEKIELLLQMQTTDESWGHVLAFLGNHLREDCPFEIGQVIHFGQKITESCQMTDFLVIPVDPVTGIDESRIQLSKKQAVRLVRLVPVYNSEVNLIKRTGWMIFIQRLSNVMTNPKRQRLT